MSGETARQIQIEAMAKTLVIYSYSGCSTCRAAVNWLHSHQVVFEERPIYTNPPSMANVRRAPACKSSTPSIRLG